MKRKRWLSLLWLLIVTIQLVQMIFLHFRDAERFSYGSIFFTVISSFIIGILLIHFFLIPLFDRIVMQKIYWQIPLLVGTGILYTFIYIFAVFALPALKNSSGWEWYWTTIEKFLVFDFHNIFKNYLFLAAALYAFEVFKKETQWLLNKKNLEIELNQSKLSALKNQLQPHFLFNSLNGIVATIDESKSRAQKMLIGLSEILRTTLSTNFKKLNTLAEEKEFLLKYLNIEKMRYEDQLQFEFTIPKEAEQFKVPALILQPILENAIKHGFKQKESLKIIIEANVEQKLIAIKNNGSPLIENYQNGTGLNHIEQRLELLQKGASFKIFQEGEWVNSQIQLA